MLRVVPSEIEPPAVAPVNTTYFLEEDGVAPLLNSPSPPEEVLQNAKNIVADSKFSVSSQTKIAENSTEPFLSASHKPPPKKHSRINTATVVKVSKRSSPTHTESNAAKPPHAKRAVNFDSCSPTQNSE